MNKDKLFSYHKWATLACLDHVQTFEEALYVREGQNSFASIQKTVEHIIGVEKLWLLRMHGVERPAFERLDVSTIEKAKESFMLLHAEMELYFASLSDEQWQELIKFKNMRGDDFENTREEMLFTVINHASYHRGQITSFLRQFGKEGTLLDYIYYAQKNR
ncbi:DinB family protein [Planococcus sp. N028]|uniref:DinB family protein n=1 Tax=Planococcus shixiaomingii TaxID=3058393 RepID=A0ABT8N706_9BACL|nr:MULTISPECIES: DinB family protein [unclassified Planococcus (in: firmicutes)]MDN7243676.1 DinB family protein [Planococcus sp. N028]WKA55814.1 DinB family protein [Planococcus sp. N022]